MCSVVPKTLDDFSKLSGVGERKLMKYGEAFWRPVETPSNHSTHREFEQVYNDPIESLEQYHPLIIEGMVRPERPRAHSLQLSSQLVLGGRPPTY